MAKFQLADMLKDVSDLNTGREQIEYIPYSCLVPDANNGYSIARVEELARSIELVGLQQPPRVWPIAEAPGTYRIISGHRRYAAIGLLIEQGYKGFDQGVPCIVDSSKASAAFRELQLIMGNAENRDKTSADHLRDINGTADCLRRLEKEGYRFPGRHREWISKMIGLSESKIGRLQAIGKNLDPTLINYFNDGRLGESIAYRISQEAADVQAELSEKLGPAVQDLTLETVEKVIGQIKKPKPAEHPSSPYRSSFDVDAYLEERRAEDAEYLDMMGFWLFSFIDRLPLVDSRTDGIDSFKERVRNSGSGGSAINYTGRAKGLELQHRGEDPILRNWTEAYDALCCAAINRLGKVSPEKRQKPADAKPMPEMDTAPVWKLGDPPQVGLYWCKFLLNGQIVTRAARWQEDTWHFANIDADIRCLCVGWWPLPEEEQT